MKKFNYLIMGCCMLFGFLAFGGCGGTPSVKSISVTTSPQIQYSVGDYLDLSGGKFTATFTDNSKRVFDLTLATASMQQQQDNRLVTVTPSQLNTAGNYTIILTYKDVSSTLNIIVSPTDLPILTVPVVRVAYNGSAQSLDIIKDKWLPAGATTTVAYKVYGSANSTYVSTPPTIVGKYTVKTTIGMTVDTESANYKGLSLETTYYIDKADLINFSLNDALDFYPTSTIVYGENFDLAQCWTQADGVTLGALPLKTDLDTSITTSIQNSMKYAYRLQNSTTWTDFPVVENKVYKKLPAGNYEIKAYTDATTNINAFEKIADFYVTKRALSAADYRINFVGSSVENITAQNVYQIAYNDSNISVQIVLSEELRNAGVKVHTAINYSLRTGSTLLVPHEVGEYKASFNLYTDEASCNYILGDMPAILFNIIN